MISHSAIYEGTVRHRRHSPREHHFSFPLFMVYLDLAELDSVFSLTRLWSMSHAAPARFDRRDYLDPSMPSLDTAVRQRLRAEAGVECRGPIRLLTHLRYFGYCFNPVSFYYCFNAAGDQLEAIVAEITNTPWGERRAYVLDQRNAERSGKLLRWQFAKDFHVSPFMPMEINYDWSFDVPSDNLFVHMNLGEDGTAQGHNGRVFDATLSLERKELTPARMRAQLVRFPLLTLQVVARIHFEALRLWMKRVPVIPHPGTTTPRTLHSGDSR